MSDSGHRIRMYVRMTVRICNVVSETHRMRFDLTKAQSITRKCKKGA